MRILDVRVGNAPTFRQQIDVRQRRGRLRRDHARNRWQLYRHFIQHQDFVEANLDMLIEFWNHMNAADAPGNIERLIFLFLGNVAL